MKTFFPHGALLAAIASLAACGGGGSDSPATPTSPTAPPTSGTYAWALKAQGPTGALRFGLSLLHPATPNVEWVIEASSSVVTDARLVSSGSVDATGLAASALKAYALIYIVGGDVRRLPMDANGTAPILRVQRARSTTACRFVVDANDYASPDNSRYVVSTAGADGLCDTADDGRAEIRLDSGGVTVTPFVGPTPLATFRDVSTLAPRGWLYARSASFWASGSTTTLRVAADPAFNTAVASTYRSALVDDGVQLSVIDFPAGTAPFENRLSAAATGGGGWCNIGYDVDSFYVYRNTSGATAFDCGATPTAASLWTVAKISRATPAATTMATGTGYLSVASMGLTKLYATVIGSADNRVLTIGKAAGAALQTDTSVSTTLTTVQTSAAGIHQRWRITNIGAGSVTYTIEMIDETGAVLYSAPGGFPLAVAEAITDDFKSSESRTRFVFAGNYGARLFGDASLIGYDSSARTATTYGALPGTADFGSDFVFANVTAGPDGFMAGFAARSANGTLQESGAKVFSFDAASSASLRYATVAQ